MINFNVSQAILEELLKTDVTDIKTFSSGLNNFAKKNNRVIRIFYMANNDEKINLPTSYDITIERAECDYGDFEKDNNNSIWIYATTNHFELITNYELSNKDIKYNISAPNIDAESQDIDPKNFKRYNSEGVLETKEFKEYEEYDKIYDHNKDEIKKIMEHNTDLNIIEKQLKSLLNITENVNDIIESILLRYVIDKSNEEAPATSPEAPAASPVPAISLAEPASAISSAAPAASPVPAISPAEPASAISPAAPATSPAAPAVSPVPAISPAEPASAISQAVPVA